MISNNSVTLVAIGKNEGRYILEWISYNLAIGFDKIIIFSNDSTDDMCEIIEKISTFDSRVKHIYWPSIEGISPQVSAYNHAIPLVKTDWVSFLDIDEFVVPFSDGNIKRFLSNIDNEISSVHINWRNFGSSNLESDDYEFVTQVFTACALPGWVNHHHFKSFARTKYVSDVHIHDIATQQGRRVLSDMKDFITENRGLSDRVVHEGIQINHYQSKTYPEFMKRMMRGDANYPSKTAREHTIERFQVLDRNELQDDKIRMFDEIFLREYNTIKKSISEK